MSATRSFEKLLDTAGRPLPKPPQEVRPSAGAVIFNEAGEVLLERRSDSGFWGLPGGGVDIGESVSDAVVREVYEETRAPRWDHALGRRYISDPRHSIASYPSGDVVHYVNVLFECRRESGELRISSESTDIRYFPPDSLPENILVAHRVRIQDAVSASDVPFIR